VCKPFVLAVKDPEVRTLSGDAYINPTAMTTKNKYYTVREFSSAYRIAPLSIDDGLTAYSSGGKQDVTYTMSGDTDGFFLNTDNGEMLGTFDHFDKDKTATQQYSIALKAVDANKREQAMETIAFNVRYPDIEVVSVGPNGLDCDNEGVRVDSLEADIADGTDGDIRFDQSFVCKCPSTNTTTYSGDNRVNSREIETIAEVAPTIVLLAAEGANAGSIVGGMFGALLVIALLGGAWYKHHGYQIKMQAFDFATELAKLMDDGTIAKDSNRAGNMPREVKWTHLTMVKQIGE